jgi:UrcA family protein
LYGRLQAAAAKVCPRAHSDPIQDRVRRGACVRGAMQDAVAKVGSAELTKIHLAKTGRSVGSLLAGK